MCRNIKTLFNFDPPVTDDEVRAASLQFVRKISGFNKPSKANEEVFLSAVDEIAGISIRLLTSLETDAQPARPNRIPPEARHLPAGVIGTPTTDSQTATGNWIPLLKDIFDAAKGIFVADPLDVYTRYTGGREYSFMTQKTLERAISDIGEELHSQYMLTYLPNNQNEAGFHEIAVQVLRPDVKIRTRDGYWLAGKPE